MLFMSFARAQNSRPAPLRRSTQALGRASHIKQRMGENLVFLKWREKPRTSCKGFIFCLTFIPLLFLHVAGYCETLAERYDKYFYSKDYQNALSTIDELLKSNPNDLSFIRERAKILAALNRDAEFILELRRLRMSTDPKSTIAIFDVLKHDLVTKTQRDKAWNFFKSQKDSFILSAWPVGGYEKEIAEIQMTEGAQKDSQSESSQESSRDRSPNGSLLLFRKMLRESDSNGKWFGTAYLDGSVFVLPMNSAFFYEPRQVKLQLLQATVKLLSGILGSRPIIRFEDQMKNKVGGIGFWGDVYLENDQ